MSNYQIAAAVRESELEIAKSTIAKLQRELDYVKQRLETYDNVLSLAREGNVVELVEYTDFLKTLENKYTYIVMKKEGNYISRAFRD